MVRTLRSLGPLSLAVVLATSCGDGGFSTIPIDPRIKVTFPDANVVGTQIQLKVQVSGCDDVTQASLYDGPRLLRTFSMDTNPQPITLSTSDISFSADGIAAQLLLSAVIVCSDGRTAKSATSGAQFLPTQAVTEESDGTSVLPRFFFADGSGDLTTFVGCAATANGQHLLQRFNQVGKVIATQNRTDLQCDDTAVFTDPGGGYRWMLIPNKGAIAFNYDLVVTAIGQDPGGQLVAGQTIVINPADGNAIIYKMSNDEQPVGNTIFRVRPNCLPGNCPDDSSGAASGSDIVWGSEPSPLAQEDDPFQLLGDPLVVGSVVLLAGYDKDIANTTIHHQVHVLDYASGIDAHDATVSLEGSDINYTLGGVGQTERMALNPQRPVVYLPFVTQRTPSVISEVRAFDETTSGTPIWTSAPFQEEIVQVVPYSNGNLLAAIGIHEVWLLNADDGTLLNPAHALKAHGSYYILYVEPGPNEELYIMTGNATTDGSQPVPSELITSQHPGLGELVRYEVGSGNLFARKDDGGNLWMRFNGSLARLFSSDTYVSLKNQ